MPSRSEGWGGLFKDEQYRLIKNSSRPSIRWLSIINRYCSSLNRPPRLCFAKGTPPNSGGEWNQVSTPPKAFKRLLDMALKLRLLILDTFGHRPRLHQIFHYFDRLLGGEWADLQSWIVLPYAGN